jgi:hypothetical protein
MPERMAMPMVPGGEGLPCCHVVEDGIRLDLPHPTTARVMPESPDLRPFKAIASSL